MELQPLFSQKRAFVDCPGRVTPQVTNGKYKLSSFSGSFLDFTFCFISVCALFGLTDCRNFDDFLDFTVLFYQRLRVFEPRILHPSVLDFYLMIYQRLRVFEPRILDPSVLDFYLMIYQRLRLFRCTDPRSVSFGFLPNDLLASARFSIHGYPHGNATRQFRTARAGRRPRRLVVPEITPQFNSRLCTIMHKRNKNISKIGTPF